MTDSDDRPADHRAEVLDPAVPAHQHRLAQLREDPSIECAPEPSDGAGAHRWVHYPWRRAVVDVPAPEEFRRVRLDRNRNLMTGDELRRLAGLRVGVVGLSVGHAIAHMLAAEGVCGVLRLADYDVLELSNLNRVPASVLDLGLNKAVACARRIAELDPYLPVEVVTAGVTADNVEAFLDGLDVVVEECDSLDVKMLVRQAARARGLPVLMATSSGGLLDVERFDQQPDRPVFHGLLGDVDADELGRLSSKEKVPHVMRIIDAALLRPRMQASLIEGGATLTTWPQLSSEVAIGAATVAEAVRRIGLGEELGSGRVRVDVPALLDDVDDPWEARRRHPDDERAAPAAADAVTVDSGRGDLATIAAAAARAPSGGNTQPWSIDVGDSALTIRVDPSLSSAMDVGYRGSAVAVGAATFNARVAAAARGLSAQVEFSEAPPSSSPSSSLSSSPLTAVVTTAPGGDPNLAARYEAMLARETNRHRGTAEQIPTEAVAEWERIAAAEGARLRLVTDAGRLDKAAALFAEADRIRYLTPMLHSQMMGELRRPGDPDPDTGIDVRSLELDAADLASLDLLRSGAVMAHLAEWDAGSALGEPTRAAVSEASALAVVSVRGDTLVDYARGGAAVEAIWISAQEHGQAVQPISPAFLYARTAGELHALSAAFSKRLADLQYSFHTLIDLESDESLILILRICRAPRPSVSSRRRQIPGRSTPT